MKPSIRNKTIALFNERGQGLIEYILILVLIAVVVLIIITGLGGTVNDTYSAINSAMP
jgi:pilus assembly protein Flp/PilA